MIRRPTAPWARARRYFAGTVTLAGMGLACLAVSAVPAGAADSTTSAPVHRTAPISTAVLGVGPAGFTVASQGPLTAPQFTSYAPDPPGAQSTFDRLSQAGAIRTYQRVWSDAGAQNTVTDLVVGLRSPAAARSYRAGQHGALAGLDQAQVAPVPGIPGGTRHTYLTAVPTDGLAQVVTFSTGRAVATITFTSAVSASDPNPAPFTAARANAFAHRQYRLLYASRYGGSAYTVPSVSESVAAGWVVLATAGLCVLALVVLTVLRLRRRRSRASAGQIPAPGV